MVSYIPAVKIPFIRNEKKNSKSRANLQYSSHRFHIMHKGIRDNFIFHSYTHSSLLLELTISDQIFSRFEACNYIHTCAHSQRSIQRPRACFFFRAHDSAPIYCGTREYVCVVLIQNTIISKSSWIKSAVEKKNVRGR